MRRLIPVLALLAAVAAASPALAKPEDTQIGHVRAVFARSGTPLLSEPKPMSATRVQVLPYGARFQVIEKRGGWFRVRTLGGTAATGWVRMTQTVSPYTMSGAGRLGATTPAASTQRNLSRAATGSAARNTRLSAAEIAAANRGFGDTHTQALRQSSAEMKRGFQMVDRVVQRKPASAAVREFQRAGGLGR